MASTKDNGKCRPSPANNASRKPRIAKSVAKKTIARAAEEATQTMENCNQAEHKPRQDMKAQRQGKQGLPQHILAQHLQSKKDTEAIKRWLCKHDTAGTHAGRRTKKGTFLDRARNIRAAAVPLTPYMRKKCMDAIAGRTLVVHHYRSLGGGKDDDLTRQHQAFVETLKTCLDILTGEEQPAHP